MDQPYQFVPVPKVITLRDIYRGHQTNLTIEEIGLLGCSGHVAVCHHYGEIRNDGNDYETHAFATSEVVRLMGGGVPEQCVARMHDVLEHMLEQGKKEDYERTLAEIEERFPPIVPFGVLALTRQDADTYDDQLYEANMVYPWVLPVKIADRMHYLVTMTAKSLESQKRKMEETLGPFLTLCSMGLEWVAENGPSELVPVYRNGIRHIWENALYEQERVERELSLKPAFA